MQISGANDFKEFYGGLYYQKLVGMNSPFESDIKKDIDRTFTHNKYFKMKNG